MPMHLRFWSPDAPGFTSENDELESVFDVIIGATGGSGIFIYDRGGDNIEFYRYFLRKKRRFHRPAKKPQRHQLEAATDVR